MSSTLILLTNYFPYFKGEEYLEAEIEVLAEHFDQVVVVPTMKTAGMTTTRSLPVGVDVLDLDLGLSRTAKMRALLRPDSAPRHRDRRFGPVRHPLRSAYDRYFEGRALGAFEQIERALMAGRIPVGSSIVIYSYWFYVTARIGVALKNQTFRGRAILVSRAHGYDVNVSASRLNYLPMRESLLEGADHVYPVADSASNYLRARYPAFARKVQTRRLGSPAVTASVRASREQLRIVTCSTVRGLKRLDVIADAVGILRSAGHDVVWTHIGGGKQSDVDRLTRHVERLKLQEFCAFLGHLSNIEVRQWYAGNRATVFVNASSSEGVPVSIMEAMSVGLPVVATDVGGTRELITADMFQGLVAAGADGSVLADRLLALFALTDSQYAAVAHASRAAWEENWNADSNYRSFAHEIAGMT
ncbi:glycosyltransferase [Agromyces italicus]|uniref:glycosyltransferase n=1 Tax=Agromyces italicus TaxID=279572 RepID=UPI0003B6C5CB|nr:glycosyltransferase [Agromyces italicus]